MVLAVSAQNLVPAISWELARKLAAWKRALERNAPPNTVRALRADGAHFLAWCWRQGREAFPASVDTVVDYLAVHGTDRGDGQGAYSYATLQRRRASIATLHQALDLPDPCRHPRVRLEMRGLATRLGRRPRQAAPLRRAALEEILAAAAAGNRAIDRRDAALLAVAYDTLRRRAELVGLRLGDIVTEPDGSGRALFRQLKGDDGRGRWTWLGPDTLARLRAWLTVRAELLADTETRLRQALRAPDARAARRQGLLRRLDRLAAARDAVWLQVGYEPLLRLPDQGLGPLACVGADPGKRLGEIFKARAAAVGLIGLGAPDEGGVSGHSLRVGAAQDLLVAGFGLPALQAAGGWASPTMPARYGERIQAGDGAMAQLAKRQGRGGQD